ncbi:MAG: copper resistance protein NlpE N-terminal domain-containing protein, partial [Bacteroidota bacterium]|nr:copper resistance protein NlpE N-terminal domain-containing protein [Bacteroidota bacterium]
DTVVFVKDAIMALNYSDSLPLGAYQGIFPCPDCDGIQQTILFTKEKIFKQEQMVWGKNETLKSSKGTWELKSDTIKMIQNSRSVMNLIKKGDTLFPVYISGIKLNNPLKYLLIKRTLAINNPMWQTKQKAGIDFTATGNEPFWSLEIDNEKFISFKLADWKKSIVVRRQNPIITIDSIFYKLKSDTTNWTITILPQFCSDGMSDYLYQYKVNVNYNDIKYKGCGVMLSKSPGDF